MKNELIAVLHFVKFVKCTCELGDNMPVITTFQVCGNIYYDCINVCSYEIILQSVYSPDGRIAQPYTITWYSLYRRFRSPPASCVLSWHSVTALACCVLGLRFNPAVGK